MVSTLQDILAIAKQALEDAEKVTESDIAPIYSDALDAIVKLCRMKQDDVAAYHYALNAVLSLFVLDRGYDYNCVDAGLRALAKHPEFASGARLAEKIRELGYEGQVSTTWKQAATEEKIAMQKIADMWEIVGTIATIRSTHHNEHYACEQCPFCLGDEDTREYDYIKHDPNCIVTKARAMVKAAKQGE